MAVKPVPDGYHTVTPYLVVTGAGAGALFEFVKQAFGGTDVRQQTAGSFLWKVMKGGAIFFSG